MDHLGIQVRLLGHVVVRRDGVDRRPGAGRRSALLAVLALTDGAARDQLVAAVWGNDPPPSATGNFYTHVNALRELFADGTLLRADGIYWLRLPELAVDVQRFEALRERGARRRAEGEPHAELAALGAALDLWNGEALAGVPGPFAEAQRARLMELRRATERRRAEVELELQSRRTDVRRAVAFLGAEATVDEVCQVTGLASAAVAHELVGTVPDADSAGLRALHDRTPDAVRTALHSLFAMMIADSSGPAERVAAQLLLAAPAPLEAKAARWLLAHVEELAARPAEAIALLRRAHWVSMSDQEAQVALTVWLGRLLFRQGEDATAEAGWAAAHAGDPDVQAEMLWVAARSHDAQGRPAAAADVARLTLSARRYAQPWLDRFRQLVLRLRLSLPGEPTEPRAGRDTVVSERQVARYRRAITPDVRS